MTPVAYDTLARAWCSQGAIRTAGEGKGVLGVVGVPTSLPVVYSRANTSLPNPKEINNLTVEMHNLDTPEAKGTTTDPWFAHEN